MNCEDFKLIVDELAEGRPMDATARVNGLAHVAICGECAARLNDAKSLCSGLQIATTAETEEAPARVRQALLASFAQHHQESVAPLAVTSIVKLSNWRTVRWLSAATLAAAAVLLIALMLPSLRRVATPSAPAAPPQTADVKGPDTKPNKSTLIENHDAPPPAPVNKPAVADNNSPMKKPTVPRRPHLADRVGNETVASNTRKTSNQYFPLTYLDSATAMESGTVVRIQVTRAALISLGLPMNSERTNELVKADLVLGDDGVARAIRLVEE